MKIPDESKGDLEERLLVRLKYGDAQALIFLTGETDELIRIFRTSLNTARERKLRQGEIKG